MSASTFRIATGSIFSLVWIFALAGCGAATKTQRVSANRIPVSSGASQEPDYTAPNASGIETMALTESDVPDYLELPAQIEADPTRVVHVYPPAGGRIIEMKVRPWQWVKQGETLAILDSPDLSRAVADYQKALADLQVKQEALKRAEDLLAHNAIAMKDYQQAQADAKSAGAELEATREEIRALGMDPANASAHLRVAAPRSGVILDIGAAQGEYSNALAAAQPLCTIADLSSVWAVGDIYEKDLTAARPGEPAQVTLDAYPGQAWNGQVSVVSDAVDPSTRTLHVRVVLANPGVRLKPAMFGSIRLLKSTSKGIVLPSTAVIREGETAYVFVADGNGRFQRRSVILGLTLGSSLEIESGVKAGDAVVTQGALLLRDTADN
ncbi:MAG: efflux RND transporter periplasmic adaptor subunit [Candidatus Acidiferrales bacterium]